MFYSLFLSDLRFDTGDYLSCEYGNGHRSRTCYLEVMSLKWYTAFGRFRSTRPQLGVL
jgi:hypothetical protein